MLRGQDRRGFKRPRTSAPDTSGNQASVVSPPAHAAIRSSFLTENAQGTDFPTSFVPPAQKDTRTSESITHAIAQELTHPPDLNEFSTGSWVADVVLPRVASPANEYSVDDWLDDLIGNIDVLPGEIPVPPVNSIAENVHAQKHEAVGQMAHASASPETKSARMLPEARASSAPQPRLAATAAKTEALPMEVRPSTVYQGEAAESSATRIALNTSKAMSALHQARDRAAPRLETAQIGKPHRPSDLLTSRGSSESFFPEPKLYHTFKLPPGVDICDFASWGIPSVISKALEQLGITALYEWQAKCLQTPGIMLEYESIGGTAFDVSFMQCAQDVSTTLYEKPTSLLYTAPTSGGKSLVADLLLFRRFLLDPGVLPPAQTIAPHQQQKRKRAERILTEMSAPKAIVCLPFKALVDERVNYYRKLLNLGNCKAQVAGLYGDKHSSIADGADIIVATYERGSNLLNELSAKGRLWNLQTAIVDEIHLMRDSGRGYTIESLLSKLKFLRSQAYSSLQIICMSATIPDFDRLAEWLDCARFQASFRPVCLSEKMLITAPGHLQLHDIVLNKGIRSLPLTPSETLVPQASSKDIFGVSWYLSSLLAKGKQVLVFVPTPAAATAQAERLAFILRQNTHTDPVLLRQRHLIAEQLREKGCHYDLIHAVRVGIGEHHARLEHSVREIMEKAYAGKVLQLLFATTTLSVGVNLPVDTVVLASTNIGRGWMSAEQYAQMCGRAGRSGHASAGESIIICQNSAEAQKFLRHLNTPPEPLHSVVAAAPERYILEYYVYGYDNSGGLTDWWNCHYSSTPAHATNIYTVVENLLHRGMLRKRESDGVCSATESGIAACRAGMDPVEAALISGHLRRWGSSLITGTIFQLLQLIVPAVDCALMWERFSDVRSFIFACDKFVPRVIDALALDKVVFERLAAEADRYRFRQPVPRFCTPDTYESCRRTYIAMIMYMALLGTPEAAIQLRMLEVGSDIIRMLFHSAKDHASKLATFAEQYRWWGITAAIKRLRRELKEFIAYVQITGGAQTTFEEWKVCERVKKMKIADAEGFKNSLLGIMSASIPYQPVEASSVVSGEWNGMCFSSRTPATRLQQLLQSTSASKSFVDMSAMLPEALIVDDSSDDSDSDDSVVSSVESYTPEIHANEALSDAAPHHDVEAVLQDGSEWDQSVEMALKGDISVWEDEGIDDIMLPPNETTHFGKYAAESKEIEPSALVVRLVGAFGTSNRGVTIGISKESILKVYQVRISPATWQSDNLAVPSWLPASILAHISSFVGFRGLVHADSEAGLQCAKNAMAGVCAAWRNAYKVGYNDMVATVKQNVLRKFKEPNLLVCLDAQNVDGTLRTVGLSLPMSIHDCNTAFWLLYPAETPPVSIPALKTALLQKVISTTGKAAASARGIAAKPRSRFTEMQDQTASLLDNYALLMQRLDESGLFDMYKRIEMPYVMNVLRMTGRGVPCNAAVLRNCLHQLEQRISALKAEMQAIVRKIPMEGIGRSKFDAASTTSVYNVLSALFPKELLASAQMTPQSISSEHLRQIAQVNAISAAGKLFCEYVAEFRGLQPLLVQLLSLCKAADEAGGRIHFEASCRTATGRTIIKHPPLQAVPKQLTIQRSVLASLHDELAGVCFQASPPIPLSNATSVHELIDQPVLAMCSTAESGVALLPGTLRQVLLAKKLTDIASDSMDIPLVDYWRSRGFAYSTSEVLEICQVVVEMERGGSCLHFPADKVFRKSAKSLIISTPAKPTCKSWMEYWSKPVELNPRAAFVVPQGRMLICADYSQLEVRVLCHLADDKLLKKGFGDNMDIFTAIGAEWFGKHYDVITSEERQIAKKVVYGILYGMGVNALGAALGIDAPQAAKYLADFKRRFPDAIRYMQGVVQRCRRQGYVETISGRRIFISDISSDDKALRARAERQAVNAAIQGSAADMLKMVVNEVETQFAKLNVSDFTAQILLTVHDEIIVECREDMLHTVIDTVVHCMQSACRLSVPLAVSVEVGKDWGHMVTTTSPNQTRPSAA